MEIFYAGDDNDGLTLFSDALLEIEKLNRLKMFTGGESLIAYLNSPDPGNTVMDILFLDINMPVKDGFTCLHQICRNSKYSKTPVIMFTTSLLSLEIEESYLNGSNLYMKKPAGFGELVNVLKKLFSDQW